MSAVARHQRRSTSAGRCPRGVTVLEASAGTGKTYTIAALAARYVAEGIAARAAPARDLHADGDRRAARAGPRAARQRRAGARPRARRRSPPTDDPVLALLATGPTHEVAAAPAPARRALADFDAATIATTHGFCQEVLGGLGVAGDVERDATFVEDLSRPASRRSSTTSTCAASTRRDRPPFDRAEALRIARVAVANPAARLEPAARRPGDEPSRAMRRRLAEAVRDEVERRKRRIGGHDLRRPAHPPRRHARRPGDGAAACARLRERYRVVLVDEFQDTDPIQWEIMRRAFGDGGRDARPDRRPEAGDLLLPRRRRLRLPRGRATAPSRSATLATNWRSDQGLIDAFDALFDGAQLGHEGIVYRHGPRGRRQPRAAAARRARRRAAAHPGRRTATDAVVTLTRRGLRVEASARASTSRDDLAADVVAPALLDAEIESARRGRLARDASRSAAATSRCSSAPTAGRARARRARARRRPGRHQRRRQRLRDTAPRDGVAAAARGARAPASATPRPRRPRSPRSSAGRAEQVAAPTTTTWEELHATLHRWAGVLAHPRRRVAARVDHRRPRRCPGASSRGSTASAG